MELRKSGGGGGGKRERETYGCQLVPCILSLSCD